MPNLELDHPLTPLATPSISTPSESDHTTIVSDIEQSKNTMARDSLDSQEQGGPRKFSIPQQRDVAAPYTFERFVNGFAQHLVDEIPKSAIKKRASCAKARILKVNLGILSRSSL